MSDVQDLLVEIGTEELPPKALSKLSLAFKAGVKKGLDAAKLKTGSIAHFATPRRLALLLKDVPAKQEDQNTVKRGPALSAAYDGEGCPTPAAKGFAGSCGVTVEELETLETDKGSWLVFKNIAHGQTLHELIPEIIERALASLPIPKRMRWGNSSVEFVRPVHWLVLLYGNEVIPATILGVQSGNHTQGHRFHHPESLLISSPSAYLPLLETKGHVIADQETRLEAIRAQVIEQAALFNGQAVIDNDLLEEVTALVEWPVALSGEFDKAFLEVPAEALISSMQDHQKYFPVLDQQGNLLNRFITVANIASKDQAQIKAGNERVIRPRLADAKFFWDQDRKQTLSSKTDGLKKMVFQKQLGTLHDKQNRLASLASDITTKIGGNKQYAKTAAQLCKCDLLTHMVNEFSDLQGVMGRYYALHDSEPDEVASAIEEHYKPSFSGDTLPHSKTGQSLALADRLDTLVGIFSIGQQPSGTKDPFALRRAALGVIRIIIESSLDIDLQQQLTLTASQFDTALNAEKSVSQVFDYIMERLRGYYTDQGVRPDLFESVLAQRPTRLLDFQQRIEACKHFRDRPEAESLAAANKRIRNILKKTNVSIPDRVDKNLLTETAEIALATHLDELSDKVNTLFDTGNYSDALNLLAALKNPVDTFFDDVMVMAEDEAVRNNRLSLLQSLNGLFLRVADFSLWQG
ncbi:MAG: glycine--tRNA ligase subunit beta [Methylococcaceae bacterium]